MKMIHGLIASTFMVLMTSQLQAYEMMQDKSSEKMHGSAAATSVSSVKIFSPADGSQLDAGEEYSLDYAVELKGSQDDHFHVWIDGKRGGPVHALKGSYTLPSLSLGEHEIAIKIVDKGHVPTGPQQSIRVTAK